MFIHTQYKILLVELDGEQLMLPTINGSHLYTLWVLQHKYKNVTLYGVVKVRYKDYIDTYYMETLWTENKGKPIKYIIPKVNPLVDIDCLQSILVVLGADAALILHNEPYSTLMELIRKDNDLIHYNSANMFYNNHVVTIQINTSKTHGVSPKLNGLPFYVYTSRKRKTFNRYAEILRKLLNVETNSTRKHRRVDREVKLSPALRDYYESQLHDFVYTYIYKGKTHERE